MKKSIVWTTAAVAAVGFGVPAFAAISSPSHVRQIAPTPVVSVDAPDVTASLAEDTSASISVASLPDEAASSVVNSVEDVSGNCDEAEHANDAACAGVNAAATSDTSTPNSVEDISGNCDEAEHANDAACTGAVADDNSGRGSGNSGSDNSGRGSNNSGHGGDDSGGDDSGHGGGDD